MLMKRCRDFWIEHSGPPPGSCLLLALSGGADSRFLLELVATLQTEWSFRVQAIHVDHQVRDEASRQREQEVLRQACDDAHVPLVIATISPGASDEDTLRTLRYAILDRAVCEVQADFILTAHHADDSLETFFLRLFRGCAPAGLCGIPVRRGNIFRPLLNIRREEIYNFLMRKKLDWFEDPTNDDTRYDRNRLRQLVLPVLAGEFPGYAGAVHSLMQKMQVDDQYFSRLVKDILASGLDTGSGMMFAYDQLENLDPALKSRVVLALLHGCGETTDSRGVKRLLALLTPDRRSGRQQYGRLLAERSGNWFWVGEVDVNPCGTGVWDGCQPLRLPGGLTVAWAAEGKRPEKVHFRPFTAGEQVKTVWGTRSVKKVLIDAGIPRVLRPLIPVLETMDGQFLCLGPLLQGHALTVPLLWKGKWLEKIMVEWNGSGLPARSS